MYVRERKIEYECVLVCEREKDGMRESVQVMCVCVTMCNVL